MKCMRRVSLWQVGHFKPRGQILRVAMRWPPLSIPGVLDNMGEGFSVETAHSACSLTCVCSSMIRYCFQEETPTFQYRVRCMGKLLTIMPKLYQEEFRYKFCEETWEGETNNWESISGQKKCCKISEHMYSKCMLQTTPEIKVEEKSWKWEQGEEMKEPIRNIWCQTKIHTPISESVQVKTKKKKCYVQYPTANITQNIYKNKKTS